MAPELVALMLLALVAGFGAAYLARLVRIGLRELAGGRPRLQAALARKPLACNTCMAFWAALPLVTLSVGAGLVPLPLAPLAQLAAAGVALGLLDWL